MAEAMLLGKPVIATGYSGNLDFMTPENSYLVDYALAPIGAGADPYPADGEWAEPDLDHAAELMREVFEDPEEARGAARRARPTSAARTRRRRPARRCSERLERIRGTLATATSTRPGAPASEAAAAQELVQARADAGGRGQPAPPRPARRRAARDEAAHEHAQQVDRGVTDALMHLGHAVESLEGRVDALVTRQRDSAALVLRELRGIDRRFGALESDRLRRARRARSTSCARAVAAHERVMIGAELTDPDDERRGARRLPSRRAVEHEYNEAHRDFVARELDDAELLARFRDGRRAARRLRARARRARGRVPVARRPAARRPRARRRLDAQPPARAHAPAPAHGRAAHRHARARGALVPAARRLLPLRRPARAAAAPTRPTTACCRSRRSSTSASTTSYYGGETQVAEDPQRELLAAVAELRRVLRPGGGLLHHRAGRRGRALRLGAVADARAARRDRRGVRARDLIDRLLPLRRRRAGSGQTARASADARYRDHFTSEGVGAGRRRGRRGGRLPAPGQAGLIAQRREA